MKIRSKGGSKDWNLNLPNKMVFSKAAVRVYLYIARRFSKSGAKALETMLREAPDGAVDAICRELCRAKEARGSWELVRMQTADGEIIEIDM